MIKVLMGKSRRAEKYFAAQSLDNQILIYNADNFRQNRKKRFAGHSVAGYACQVGFSPDGRYAGIPFFVHLMDHTFLHFFFPCRCFLFSYSQCS